MYSFGRWQVAEEEEEDSDGEESDSEGDLAFDEYTVSERESDYEWMYSLLRQCILLVLECLSNFLLAGCIYLEFYINFGTLTNEPF